MLWRPTKYPMVAWPPQCFAIEGGLVDYRQFIAKVQEYGGLPREDSLKIIEVVLETLGERLSKKHREHLAAQLPRELKPFVLKHRKTELFSLELFYQHIAARARLSFHDSIRYSRMVIRVLQEAVAEGELQDIFAEIPPEFDELSGRKPTQISPTSVDTHDFYPRS